MAFSLTEPLVIGISSRALFDLEEENRIYEREGLAAYEAYQVQHENDVLRPGAAFPLVQAFLALNRLQAGQLVEVIIMSRNSPNTSLRIFRSVQEYGLDISRAALSGGEAIAPYLKSYETDLFLSANADDVQQAIDAGVAAGVILPGNLPENPRRKLDQIRIAFDGDAVLFASDSERIFQREGIDAFFENEQTMADVPLREGPFAPFLRTLAHIQSLFADREEAPIRTALGPDPHRPRHEPERPCARASDPHAARLGRARGRGAFPRRRAQGAGAQGLRRAHLLRRSAPPREARLRGGAIRGRAVSRRGGPDGVRVISC